MHLLAQRDYTESILRKKLQLFAFQQAQKKLSKSFESDSLEELSEQVQRAHDKVIRQVIDYCYLHHLLNDKQYIEQYLAMRSRKGYGKNHIIMDLKQKGVIPADIVSVLEEYDINWISVAKLTIEKKFKVLDKKDIKQKNRVYRFLLSRGFSQAEIQHAYQQI